MKQLTEDPYVKAITKYEVGKNYPAVITKVQDYGCFAKLEEGLEGLIHQSELSWTKKTVHPGKVLSTSENLLINFPNLLFALSAILLALKLASFVA